MELLYAATVHDLPEVSSVTLEVWPEVRGQSAARNGRQAVYDADARELWLRSEALTCVNARWSIAS